MSFPLLLARGARACPGALLVVLAAVACDTTARPLDPSAAAANFDGVAMTLDLPTVALVLGAASSPLHALRPSAHGVDTVAAFWHSADDAIVTVDSAGNLTPHAAGRATVWARIGRDSVASLVTVGNGPLVQGNLTPLTIRPAVTSMAVGVPQQLSVSSQAMAPSRVATVAGTAPPSAGPAVVWTSSAPAVAAVSSNGTVVPISPGTAVITATSNDARATSVVTVVRTSTSASRIEMAVMRFDGASGPVLVSNGVPFPRGTVTEASLPQLHVFVNGVEQAVATRALGGRWPDGSLRAALVQFDYSIPDARTIPAYVTIGGARTIAGPAERPAAPAPRAALLPTSSAYLISTELAGAVYDPSATRAPTTIVAQYEADYVRLSASDWARCGAAWDCGRTAGYDRPYILYQQWIRTGNPTYWQRATAVAGNYMDGYIVPNGGWPTPWWSNSEGLALHYFATGDERTRGYLFAVAASLAYQTRPGSGWGLGPTPAQRGDDRMRAKTLMALMDAKLVDARPTPSGPTMKGEVNFYVQFLATHPLADAVSDVLSTQQASGGFGGTQYAGGQKNFMVGMLMTALIRYHDQVSADARIPAAIKKSLDYMWAKEWVPSAHGFKYCTTHVDNDDGDQPEPSLNNLIAPAYAWYYARSGDARYAGMVDEMLVASAAADRNWWDVSGKSFDQAFAHGFNVFQWRNR